MEILTHHVVNIRHQNSTVLAIIKHTHTHTHNLSTIGSVSDTDLKMKNVPRGFSGSSGCLA